jgi:hypothetical protein
MDHLDPKWLAFVIYLALQQEKFSEPEVFRKIDDLGIPVEL